MPMRLRRDFNRGLKTQSYSAFRPHRKGKQVTKQDLFIDQSDAKLKKIFKAYMEYLKFNFQILKAYLFTYHVLLQ